MIPLAVSETVIDASGVAARIEARLPTGVRRRQLSVRTLLAGMCLAQADHRPAHLNRRREDGDRHAAAQRNLFGRMLGCLHHCLATGQHYDEATAFPDPRKNLSQAA